MGCIVFVESCILDNSMYRKDICVQEAASLIFLASTGHPNPLDQAEGMNKAITLVTRKKATIVFNKFINGWYALT